MDTLRIPHHLADLLLHPWTSEAVLALALAQHDVNHRLVFLKLSWQSEVNFALTLQPESRLAKPPAVVSWQVGSKA